MKADIVKNTISIFHADKYLNNHYLHNFSFSHGINSTSPRR
ncbi:MAG: hypothetical protein PHC75_04400 [Burkholderiales bacterium]|nr:hypothetical protein [Burkholderiales bacterium]